MVDVAPGNIEVPRLISRKRIRAFLIVLLLGAVIGAAASYALTRNRVVPVVVQGTVRGVAADSDEADVTAIAFRFDDRDYATPGEGESIPVVTRVPWTDATGENHEGDRPACLAAGRYDRVEIGVLDVGGSGIWSSQLVVWVHCLS